jgi:coniferyl-aldehyde dehydrogenase
MSDNAPITEVLGRQRAAFQEEPYPDAATRVDRLRRLRVATREWRADIVAACQRDFGCRAAVETLSSDITATIYAARYAERNVRRWMRPRRRKVSLLHFPSRNRVLYQPLGVVGIIAPWNYPVYTSLGPVCGALAAGNRIMLKLSEHTPGVSEALADMVAETFAPEEVAVIEGGTEIGAAFAELPLDHLLFTGSTGVGRLVMQAAAKNLTPVTLELGGKSPCIISNSADLAMAARRVCFGKSYNAGQSCVAPDYVLCPAGSEEAFIIELSKAFTSMYPTVRDNPDCTAIINAHHAERLQACLDDAEAQGARIRCLHSEPADLSGTRQCPITVVQGLTDSMRLAQEEIFGPVLPVLSYEDMDEAIGYIAQRPRPLALYYFGKGGKERNRILQELHAGGVCVNDTLVHLLQDDLPFGGLGPSGIGAYHGPEGFETFSHAKAIHSKGRLTSTGLLYPPYTDKHKRLLDRLM